MTSLRITILVAFFCSTSQAFIHQPLPWSLKIHSAREYEYRLFASSSSVDSQNEIASKKEKKGMTTLHFKGEKVFQTDPLPLESMDVLQSFFEREKDEIRSILLSGSSGKNTVVALPGKEGVKEKEAWSKQCQVVGGNLPSFENGDVVYRVNADGMNMGGLQIKNEMLIGATTKIGNTGDDTSSINTNSPEYQFVFISDKRIAEGPRLLVWVFNKLMGAGKKDDGEDTEQAITSLTRFYANTISKDEVIFTLESSLDIAVKFPSFMLKILPVSKEKAEEEGSASVMKTLVKDTEPVLAKLSQFYLNSTSYPTSLH